jgi:hypothetical protein
MKPLKFLDTFSTLMINCWSHVNLSRKETHFVNTLFYFTAVRKASGIYIPSRSAPVDRP